MVIVRPTRKLQALLPPRDAVLNSSDTALGDWYVIASPLIDSPSSCSSAPRRCSRS